MNKKNIIILSSAVAILIIAVIVFICIKISEASEPNEDVITITDENKPKGFIFYDEYTDQMKISDFIGTPIVLAFWNSSSSASLDMLELLEEVYNDYRYDVKFLVIDTNETNEDIIQLVRDYEFKFSVYYDLDNLAKNYYSFIKLPSLIFLNADGTKSSQIESKINEKNLRTNLDKIVE